MIVDCGMTVSAIGLAFCLRYDLPLGLDMAPCIKGNPSRERGQDAERWACTPIHHPDFPHTRAKPTPSPLAYGGGKYLTKSNFTFSCSSLLGALWGDYEKTYVQVLTNAVQPPP